jgi:hypothetical protein
MARASFGGTADDFVYTTAAGGLMRAVAASVTIWSAKTGGVQLTDLLLNGSPVTQLEVGADGQIPEFQGPDSVYEVWASANGNARVKLSPATSDARNAADMANPASATRAAANAVYVAMAAAAKNPDLLITGAITRNGNGVVTSAVVLWPDGKPGVFTTDTIGSLNTVDGYHITHVDGAVTKTYTQPTVTRDGNGAATNVPAITVT